MQSGTSETRKKDQRSARHDSAYLSMRASGLKQSLRISTLTAADTISFSWFMTLDSDSGLFDLHSPHDDLVE